MIAAAIKRMSWSKAAGTRLHGGTNGDYATNGGQALSASQDLADFVRSLHQRQKSGEETSLRQLHTISRTDQPQALRMLRRLEQMELVQIDNVVHDEFASRVVLKAGAMRRLRAYNLA